MCQNAATLYLEMIQVVCAKYLFSAADCPQVGNTDIRHAHLTFQCPLSICAATADVSLTLGWSKRSNSSDRPRGMSCERLHSRMSLRIRHSLPLLSSKRPLLTCQASCRPRSKLRGTTASHAHCDSINHYFRSTKVSDLSTGRPFELKVWRLVIRMLWIVKSREVRELR